MPPNYESCVVKTSTLTSVQVKPTATKEELRKAYKVMALKYHPGRSS